jgi:flagellar hook assembly protein FlgD
MPDAGAYEWSSSTGVTNAPTPGISLEQNAPNPFNPSTRIAYTVSAVGARVDIGVFDVRGSLVRTLVDGRPSSGRVVVVWDGRDDAGREVPSGVYFYRLTAGPTTITRRMTLLK